MELTIGIILVVGLLVVLRARKNKSKSENKEISSTVLPLPPKPPTGTPT